MQEVKVVLPIYIHCSVNVLQTGDLPVSPSEWYIIKVPGSNEPRARRSISCLTVGVFGHDPLQPLGEKHLYVETSGMV